MPPRARIASLAESRLKSTSEPVTTMVSPSRVRRDGLVALVLHGHAGGLPRVDDGAVPVDVEPLDDGLGDGRADPLGGGQLLLGRAADRGHRPELLGQRPGRGRADVADREPDQHPPQRHLLGPVEVVEQPLAVGREHPALALGLLGGAGEQLGLAAAWPRRGRRRRPRSSITLALEQRDRRLVAEALDVEGAAAGDVEDPLAHLGRTELVVGAAEVLVALLLLGQRRCRRRDTRSASPTRPARRAQRQHRADDLGDHVAGLAQDRRCRRGGRPCA